MKKFPVKKVRLEEVPSEKFLSRRSSHQKKFQPEELSTQSLDSKIQLEEVPSRRGDRQAKIIPLSIAPNHNWHYCQTQIHKSEEFYPDGELTAGVNPEAPMAQLTVGIIYMGDRR